MAAVVASNLELDNSEAEKARVDADGVDTVVIPVELPQGVADDNTVDWDGPDDPENPLNWPTHKNFGHVILVSVLSLITWVLDRSRPGRACTRSRASLIGP
jgi:hypothetical protein